LKIISKRPAKRATQRPAPARVIAAGAGQRLTKKKKRAGKRVVAAPKGRAASASPRMASTRTTPERQPARASKARASKPRGARQRGAPPDTVLERLSAAIPRPHVELAFDTPWQLLVAVILSAQSTDRRVNQVTPEVFQRWPSPAALAAADPTEVEEVIKSTGFFRNKTRAIIGASAMLVERFAGEVPRAIDELVEVPGVARKTANVVLGAAYQIASGMVVDTHAARVSQRLGLTRESAPEKIESDLCRAFAAEHWRQMSHRLVLHGRYVCTARAPACEDCALNEACPSREKPPDGTWEARAEHEARAMEERAAGFTRL
jgi:endonuclease-3